MLAFLVKVESVVGGRHVAVYDPADGCGEDFIEENGFIFLSDSNDVGEVLTKFGADASLNDSYRSVDFFDYGFDYTADFTITVDPVKSPLWKENKEGDAIELCLKDVAGDRCGCDRWDITFWWETDESGAPIIKKESKITFLVKIFPACK